jgi:hypothetical protein
VFLQATVRLKEEVTTGSPVALLGQSPRGSGTGREVIREKGGDDEGRLRGVGGG